MSARKTIVIAEAGVNHNGSIELAKELINVAAAANCDFVKFQSFKADRLASPKAKKAEYQEANDSRHDSQLAMLKALELSEEDHSVLINHCKEKGIEFLSTAFDELSADFLEPLVSLYKIPSGEITNLPYLRHLAKKGKKIVMSTGMATPKEIEEAIATIEAQWKNTELSIQKDLTVLHCTTSYPTPMEDVNLLAINYIKERFNVPVGYSDHTLGITVPIGAVAMGATLIEKHFTLDREMEGPDHKASLEPKELIEMVKSIREMDKALGLKEKKPTPTELKNKAIARKSLHFKNSLKKGSKVTREDIIVLRPEGGLHPRELDNIIGKVLSRDVEAYDKVVSGDFN